MSLTVGLDARKIRDYGIGRYLEGLLRGFASEGGETRFVLFLRDGTLASLPGDLGASLDPARFRAVPCRAGLYSVAELFAFRGIARREGLDLLHFPHYVRALAPGCPVVVTIHDPIHLVRPPSAAAKLYAWTMMQWSARTAAALFTGAEASRAELVRRLHVPVDRFRVTPYGVGEPFRRPEAAVIAAFRERRHLERPFVLCVASHRPHKNLAGASEAFRRAALAEAELVVPARDALAASRLAALRTADRTFRILENVGDEELSLLYAAARVVLVPSLHEGFGLAGLEAGACGAVVLASDIGPHREVLGDAAALVDARRPDLLARELASLWSDEERRRELARRGPEHAARFSWERTARLTLEGYARAGGRS